MIRVVLLDGPLAGRVRSSADLAKAGCPPEELLGDIARHGWRWQVLWPVRPEQPQSWAGGWLAGIVESIREEHGIDLAGMAEGGAPDAVEVAVWARADMAARIVAALHSGRAVRFMGRRWSVPAGEPPHKQAEAAGQIEDAIVESGRYVTLLADDGEGDVVIGTCAPDREN
jgi:hypothetical protein